MKEPPSASGSRGDEGVHSQVLSYLPLTDIQHYSSHSADYQDQEQQFDLNDFCHADADYEPPANNFDPASCAVPEQATDLSRRVSQPPLQYSPPSNNESFPRGPKNHVEPSWLPYTIQPHVVPSPYNQPSPHPLHVSGNSARMSNPPYYERSTPQLAQNSGSKYGPYRSQFDSTESASKYRKEATRFNRKPYRPPDTDETIAEVERDRLYHVERIYNAMTRGDAARDNKNSIAMKRWVHGAYYKPELVEAYAHKVLHCLLLQTKEGFRGWVHNDYVADDRKGEDEDRDVTCEERLESILQALEEEKTICEDVMNSACQIRMFVNAPKAYANRKYQNRVGNSKRGKAKDSDINEPPSKARKLNLKSTTRTRRTASNLLPATAPHARLQSRTPGLSPLQHSQLRFATPPPFADSPDGPLQLAPMQPQSVVQQRMFAVSPRPMDHPPMQRMSAIPPRQQTPLISTPVLSHGHHSAPTSPEDAKVIYNPDIQPWLSMPNYDANYHSGDAPLFEEPWTWSGGQLDQVCTGANANLFAVRPEAAEEALSASEQVHGTTAGVTNFSDYWQRQQGVQQLPDLRIPRYGDPGADV